MAKSGKPSITQVKPSNFKTTHPWDSIVQRSETEDMARVILSVLQDTGDTWRELTWSEFKKSRPGWAGYKHEFDSVISYCTTPTAVISFSRSWYDLVDHKVKAGPTADQKIASVLSLIGNVDHSTGNGEHSAKLRGELLNDIRTILSQ